MLKCLMTNSTQWAENGYIRPRGIVLHSTGVPGAYLRRYVQPSNREKNKEYILATLGVNQKHNDWNHIRTDYNFHYWIGKDNSGKVILVKTLPDYLKAWEDNFIHVCVCEDNLDDEKYLRAALGLFVELCDNLCDFYNLDKSTVKSYSEISDSVDIEYWLEMYGISMRQVVDEIGTAKTALDKSKNF